MNFAASPFNGSSSLIVIDEGSFSSESVENLSSSVRFRSSGASGAGAGQQSEEPNTTLLIALKGSILFLLSPLIVCSNFLILAALYRYKRLRTASNFFIASLASSDLGTGLCLPFTVYIQSSSKTSGSLLCLIPHCAAITLSSASVIVMAAIAIDRFTSLAQPLQYNNLMTRASVHKYIACVWVYALVVGFIPLLYRALTVSFETSFPIDDCTFAALLSQPMQLLLFCAVYGPSAFILIGCYGYIYVVARYHARAIHTVELSMRQHQDCTHSRYGQTLAMTVGLFVFFWIPYQVLLLQDIVRGTSYLKNWLPFSLSLSIYLSSVANPWIYGYKSTEIRNGVHRLVQDFLKCIGYKTSKYTYPVNVMVASTMNAEHAAAVQLNRITATPIIGKLPVTNLSPMKYTNILMSTLHESELTSTTTTICRLDTAACLTHDYSGLLEINDHIHGTPC